MEQIDWTNLTEVLHGFARKIGKQVGDLLGTGVQLLRKEGTLREEIGHFTFDDIVGELEKPGRDPRDEFVPFQFLEGVHEVSDLRPGMLCPGVVTNVTNFGAFVDIGVHQDGLVHVSQLADRFVKDPRDVVSPGDRVTVRVLEVNLAKNQIALTMKSGEQAARPKGEPQRPRQEGPRRAPEQSSGPLKNDALKKLEAFKAALKRGQS